MVLSLQQIKAVKVADETKDILVTEWGGEVRLKKLGAAPAIALGRKYSAAKKDADNNIADEQEMVDFFVLLIANSIVDGEGNREFMTTEGQEFLGKQPLAVLSSIASEAMRLNGFSDDKAVEEIEKKLPSAPIGSSPSASPKDSATPIQTKS